MVNEKPRVGIIGIGMVGTPLKRYFEDIKGHIRGTDLFLFDTDPQKGYDDDVNQADIIFVCVPTPPKPDRTAELLAVESAFDRLKGAKIVVIKSTVPPGTTESFQKKYPDHRVLFNPEFLTERNAWENFIHPDRQIVGFTAKSHDRAPEVLRLLPAAAFMSPAFPISNSQTQTFRVEITATEAELIKYAGNIYLTRKVNFANAIARATKHLGADYERVQAGMAADTRIGASHLDVGHGGYRGFGGYCFPKDLAAFIAHMDQYGESLTAELLKGDWTFNEKLLATQGLTVEDVSVHDDEWIRKKLKIKMQKSK